MWAITIYTTAMAQPDLSWTPFYELVAKQTTSRLITGLTEFRWFIEGETSSKEHHNRTGGQLFTATGGYLGCTRLERVATAITCAV